MRRSLKDILRQHRYVLNSYIVMPDPVAAEFYARQGWDAVTLDMQHGLIGYESALAILQALSGIDVVPLARVPWLDPAAIMKALDAGILGITCPMINTRDEAERLVRYCKYPPRGERSHGPLRAALLDGDGYRQSANAAVNVFAMIETEQGVANAEEILAVDGLDGVYLGLGDLAISLGLPPRADNYDAPVERAVERMLELCARRGLIAGVQAQTPESAWRMIERGFGFITLSSDVKALTTQARAWVSGLRRLSGQ
jgi:4-hydroxy-2-oxoheptanedioate aldolase